MIDDNFELPELPVIDKGPPPECPMCGDPMGFIDGDWCCVDCNGELLGPETGQSLRYYMLRLVTGPFHPVLNRALVEDIRSHKAGDPFLPLAVIAPLDDP